MRFITLLLTLILAGCGGLNQMVRDFSDSASELMGTYSAPVLAGTPKASGCGDQRCKTLDTLEANGYEMARQKKITWMNLVDSYYQKRAELYPSSQDSQDVNEFRAYQRALAEQMDLGKITETQWAYLIESKMAEIRVRNQAVTNSAPRQTNCTTTNLGANTFPQYQTTCN